MEKGHEKKTIHTDEYTETKTINTVVAAVQEKLFKRKYRLKRVNLACHDQNRFKREFVLFWEVSLKSNL